MYALGPIDLVSGTLSPSNCFLSTDTVGDDCPIFDGLFDYCAISAGGSMGALLSGVWARKGK